MSDARGQEGAGVKKLGVRWGKLVLSILLASIAIWGAILFFASIYVHFSIRNNDWQQEVMIEKASVSRGIILGSFPISLEKWETEFFSALIPRETVSLSFSVRSGSNSKHLVCSVNGGNYCEINATANSIDCTCHN